EFEMRGKRHPELEAAGAAWSAFTAAVPHAAPGAHPLDAARRQQAARPVGVLEADAAFGDVGQRRDTRMRMQPEALRRPSAIVEQVEEDERLQHLTQVARADQPSDPALGVAGCAMDDGTAGNGVLNERV